LNKSSSSFRKTLNSSGKTFRNPPEVAVFLTLFDGVGKQLGGIFLKTDGGFNGRCFPYLVSKGASSGQCSQHTAV
jgi:hypothetical protein